METETNNYKTMHSKIERYCGIKLGTTDKFFINRFLLENDQFGYVNIMINMPYILYDLGYRSQKIDDLLKSMNIKRV